MESFWQRHRWLVVTAAILGVAMLFQLRYLAYVMYAVILVEVGSRALTAQWIKGLGAARTADMTKARIGQTCHVTMFIHNRGSLPVPWVIIEEMVPPGLPRTGEYARMATLWKGQELRMSYSVELRKRGYHQFGPCVMETGDLFGLHRRWRIDQDPAYVLVYPRVLAIAAAPITSRRPVGEIKIAHRIYEDPVRISGIRDYVPGDSLRRVHWKASARTGRLQCKVFEPSVMVGATLVLDFHEDGYADRDREDRSEMAVTLTASLAYYIFRNRQQVGFLSNGRDAADRVRLGQTVNVTATRRHAEAFARPVDRSERLAPVRVETRRGADQAMRIMEALARLELTDGLSFVEMLNTEQGHLSRDAAVIAVVSQVSPEKVQRLAGLARSGWHVIVFIVADAETATRAQTLLLSHRLRCFCITRESDITDLSLV